jgi:heme/copper-type cytochrome/quinol oxidase subunit 2
MSQATPKISRIVLAIALIAIILASASIGLFLTKPAPATTGYRPTTHTREFYLFSTIIDFNETKAGIPHDIFSAKAIEVNQGDKVIVHFFNTEEVSTGEHHTFTIPAYNINVDLAPGQKQDIEFTATEAGIFNFVCTYHLPTMQGELIVLPTQ